MLGQFFEKERKQVSYGDFDHGESAMNDSGAPYGDHRMNITTNRAVAARRTFAHQKSYFGRNQKSNDNADCGNDLQLVESSDIDLLRTRMITFVVELNATVLYDGSVDQFHPKTDKLQTRISSLSSSLIPPPLHQPIHTSMTTIKKSPI